MRVKSIMLAGLVSVMSFPAISAEPLASSEGDPKDAWRQTLRATPPPEAGCFEASYPSTAWEQVTCAEPSQKPLPSKRPQTKVVGGSNDWSLQAPEPIKIAVGEFPRGEVGLAPDSDPYYSLQLNTNMAYSTLCGDKKDNKDCVAWQLFVYDSGLGALTGDGALYVQSWLFNYNKPCPAGWNQYGGDCMKSTRPSKVPTISVREITNIKMSAFLGIMGEDGVTIEYNGRMYVNSAAPNIPDMASIWNWAEFNVFGELYSEEIKFTKGSYLDVRLGAQYPSDQTVAPTCVRGGNIGQTNNMTLSPSCTVVPAETQSNPYANPYIEFSESVL
ncbi:hypothetical protein [Phyllobacterium leguminum]|uniref:Polysaccharide lyase-like protein n=1 Tax=Phyllobacterium leguminum TaxID=314237 RepID=A0A318T2L3_9HYPH|nr:hypothetical protein [Phyllobacterium leguminum]PYE88138.1 hypothetical protein C7477_1088 [Phyllobacterium leguminum]